MQRNIKSLIGYSMRATDGEIGNVEEFYFDDKTWAIRYLIVNTGGWMSGRTVLISPLALQKIDWGRQEFPTSLTKGQISNSPDIDVHKPVSRQHEIALYQHYAWQPYWGSGFYAGGLWGVMPAAPLFDERIIKEDNRNEIQSDNDDPHLRTTDQVTSYNIHAIDGDIGHVNDFIIDDKTWQILYLVVDTHNWIGGKKVLIAVENIKEIAWEKSKVAISMYIAEIKESELFHESNYNHPENAHSSSENSNSIF